MNKNEKTITVKKLMAQLSKFNPNLPVYVNIYDDIEGGLDDGWTVKKVEKISTELGEIINIKYGSNTY